MVLDVILKLNDHVEQDHYLGQIAELIGVSIEALRSKMGQKGASPALKRNKAGSITTPQQELEMRKVQEQFLAITLLKPKLRTQLEEITEAMFLGESAKAIWQFLQSNPDFNGDPKTAQQLKKDHDYVKILTLQYEALYKDLDEVELAYQTNRLKVRLIELFIKQQKTQLAEQLRTADEATTERLLTEVKRLDKILQSTMENLS